MYYIVCINESRSYETRYSLRTVVSLEPIATFSTKSRAQNFVDEINKSERSISTEIINVSDSLPHDLEGIPVRMRNKYDLVEREDDWYDE
jgi:hypothetical protein